VVDDGAIVTRQLGRRPQPFTVVTRCAGGRPLVIRQEPWTVDGVPFPTTFWLTCPALVAAVGRLESAGGVAELERRLADDPALAAAFDDGRRRQIALRPELGDLGIAGTGRERSIKCLHAHAAFALGAPPYPIGEEILARAGGVPPVCCMREAP
jgi:uncharacterized protein